MTNLHIEEDTGAYIGTYIVEWFEAEGHVFDACGMSESDKAALEKLKETYDRLNVGKRAELRGMLHLVEDGLTNGYLLESAEVLARVWDSFQIDIPSISDVEKALEVAMNVWIDVGTDADNGIPQDVARIQAQMLRIRDLLKKENEMKQKVTNAEVRMAPYKTIVFDGRKYGVRNVFEHHEPRPDLDVLASENMVDGAHGCAYLYCVNAENEDDRIFVPLDAGFSPFDLVYRMTELKDGSVRVEDVWPRETALVTNHVADENGQLVEAGQIEVTLDVDLNVTQDNWPLTPMERPDNSERDAEALAVIKQWEEGSITYLEMVQILETKVTSADGPPTCRTCLNPMGQFKSSCCGEIVCTECDWVCPKCGKSVFNKENN